MKKILPHNRNMLLLSALDIVKNEFWFGTGIGLDNYRKAFHKHSMYYKDSKAHNFYISYLAELGFFGFVMLLIILKNIYQKLSKDRKFYSFRISFLSISIMMFFNEYIGTPELWFFYGMLIGTCYSFESKKKMAEKEGDYTY
mgnify:CR=1 FL=1